MTPAATGSRSRRSGREGALLNEAQMESLVRTIDLGSINAAARELFISPPSLHQRLGTLEAELGCTLLERCPRGVRPTAEGTRMYAACVACLEQLAAARHDIARLRDENALHEVRIGVTWRPSLHTYYAIEELHASHSNLAVSAVKVTEKPLVSALLDGGIDLFESPRLAEDPAGLAFWPFGEDAYRCVCGPDSRWASLDLVTLPMLEGVTVYAGSDYRDYRSYRTCAAVQRLCARDNFKATAFPTERIVADCMSGTAVVLFPSSRANDLCPPLVHVPLDIPLAEFGAYTRERPTEGELVVVEALRTQALK